MLMYRLLMRDAYRGWETINSDPPLYESVTAEDIKRVANTYFTPENRAVAIYYRKESDGPEDTRLAGLDQAERQQVRQMQAVMESLGREQLAEILNQLEQNATQVPPENQDMTEVVIEMARERLASVGAESR